MKKNVVQKAALTGCFVYLSVWLSRTQNAWSHTWVHGKLMPELARLMNNEAKLGKRKQPFGSHTLKTAEQLVILCLLTMRLAVGKQRSNLRQLWCLDSGAFHLAFVVHNDSCVILADPGLSKHPHGDAGTKSEAWPMTFPYISITI